ncbi:MAG: dihydrolipoamide dehydrogenase [Glaciecola sp.]|jgi:dihydrolipoamide dehydrogenase
MPETKQHDIVVLGGGPGGYAVAFRAVARGLDVALVEADKIGGTCLNRGCIPSKSILHVAETLAELERANQYGLKFTYEGLDGDQLDAFREKVMDTLRGGLESLVKKRTTLHVGRGEIVDAGSRGVSVKVTAQDGTETMVSAKNVVIATGSVPRSIPGIDVDGTVVQTSDEALWFKTAPKRAVIIGAGAIGMEFASMWKPMGTEVTVVEALDRVLPLEDADTSKAVARAYKKRKITVLTGAKVKDVKVKGGQARVTIDVKGKTDTLEADVVLMAIGRGPRSSGIGADSLGVLDERGFVRADDRGRALDANGAHVAGVWAVGDVLPTLALAHAAFAEGFVVADEIAGKPTVPVDYDQVPKVTYCHPEAASVGLTQAQAQEKFGAAEVACTTYSLKANAKGIIANSDGFVKIVALKHGPGAEGDGEVLGVHVVGPHATDLIAEATLATAWGALPSELAAITHAHPTLYEAMGEAFQAAAGLPFHGH